MPLRVNVGLSKKLGLPNYGSTGASCAVEIELDGGLLQYDLEAFHRHVHNAFIACRQAVQDELARYGERSQEGANGAPPPNQTCAENSSNGNGSDSHDPGEHSGAHDLSLESVPQRISKKQLEYATQLAGKIRGLGIRRLEGLAQKMFGKPLAELSSLDGSNLIEVLKDIRAGKLELHLVLPGAAT